MSGRPARSGYRKRTTAAALRSSVPPADLEPYRRRNVRRILPACCSLGGGMMTRVTAIVADDEPLARAHLRLLLDAHDVETVSEAENAVEVLRFAEDLHPDIIFLD